MNSRYLKLGVAAVTVGAVVVIAFKQKEHFNALKVARAANKTLNQVGAKK